MKKTLRIILLCILVMIVSTTCFATSNEVVTKTEEDTSEELTEELSEEDLENINYEDLLSSPYNYVYGDVYSFDANTLTSTAVIYGNVYLMGNNLNLEVTAILGNLYIMGNDISIKAQEITGNIFAMGNSVTIESVVDTAVYVAGESLDLTVQTYHLYGAANNIKVNEGSQIAIDARLTGNNIEVDGIVGNNLYTAAEKITLGDTCVVYNSIEYTGEAEVPETLQDKLVKKETVSPEDVEKMSTGVISSAKSLSLAMNLVYAIAAILLIAFLTKKSEVYTTDIKKNVVKNLLLGLICLVLIPVISVILIITAVGVFVGIALLVAYVLLLTLAIPATATEVSKLILGDRATSKSKVVILAIGLSAVLMILDYIPVLGAIINLICTLYGFGYIMRKILYRNKKDLKPEVKTETSSEEPVEEAIEPIAEEKQVEEAVEETVEEAKAETEAIKEEVSEEKPENSEEPEVSDEDNKEE